MTTRDVRIYGIGKYLPKQIVRAEDMDKRIGTEKGWVAKKSGVLTRHFIEDETASEMGAIAATEALADANLHLSDIDCIVSASGTVEQAIPSTASLIYQKLDPNHCGIPAFDINSTCLSFVTALDHLSYLVHAGRYRHVLIISSEIASVGLNWNHKESCSLFGDGAAAVVIGPTQSGESSQIITSRMETFPQGAQLSEIRGGGSRNHPRNYPDELNMDDFLFDMQGEAIFRMSARLMKGVIKRLFTQSKDRAPLTMEEMKLVIPHQASLMAMKLIQKRLSIRPEQMLIIAQNHGNVIAASIAIGLYEAIKKQKIKRGDRILLLGTSAGLSIGGLVLDY
ncbi:beta-ketoacyl-ACP synthase III [Hazenella sp. IB182353]|uniref:beta-ketoacyl-ACP synthase III n=1 Tax=Polycladospora coralii TaxID=2771432 RepID=UPI001745F7EE|nr:beta-ketoacyl-ACP synthase III [Polycladospora coralii]MBS7530417.1 beta-ketoacyl-ACP synthase III [Polycladospora coralii]